MLEYWNDGILGFAKIGHVVIGKMSLDFGVYKIDKRKTFFQNQHSIIPPPHYSTSPLFHVRDGNSDLEKHPLFSIILRISDTFD